MTDHPEPDPRLTFQADQAEAQAEVSTRDETAWSLNVRNGTANARQTEAIAAYWKAKGEFWDALGNLVFLVFLAALIVSGWLAVAYVVGVVR